MCLLVCSKIYLPLVYKVFTVLAYALEIDFHSSQICEIIITTVIFNVHTGTHILFAMPVNQIKLHYSDEPDLQKFRFIDNVSKKIDIRTICLSYLVLVSSGFYVIIH